MSITFPDSKALLTYRRWRGGYQHGGAPANRGRETTAARGTYTPSPFSISQIRAKAWHGQAAAEHKSRVRPENTRLAFPLFHGRWEGSLAKISGRNMARKILRRMKTSLGVIMFARWCCLLEMPGLGCLYHARDSVLTHFPGRGGRQDRSADGGYVSFPCCLPAASPPHSMRITNHFSHIEFVCHMGKTPHSIAAGLPSRRWALGRTTASSCRPVDARKASGRRLPLPQFVRRSPRNKRECIQRRSSWSCARGTAQTSEERGKEK